jgi:hypothetical protein
MVPAVLFILTVVTRRSLQTLESTCSTSRLCPSKAYGRGVPSTKAHDHRRCHQVFVAHPHFRITCTAPNPVSHGTYRNPYHIGHTETRIRWGVPNPVSDGAYRIPYQPNLVSHGPHGNPYHMGRTKSRYHVEHIESEDNVQARGYNVTL